jgi:hypothetical protein
MKFRETGIIQKDYWPHPEIIEPEKCFLVSHHLPNAGEFVVNQPDY